MSAGGPGKRQACLRRPGLGRMLVVLLFLVGFSADAYLPSPERIYQAIAATNRADGRDESLRLSLTLQIGDRPGVATAELISHPSGLARIELRGAGGLLERHLLQGDHFLVVRNGEAVEDPRTFLPPLFLLQAKSGERVRNVLETLSVQGDAIGLATCGDEDCLLIGDLTRAIPRPEPPPVRGVEAWEAARADGISEVSSDSESAAVEEPPPEEEESVALVDEALPENFRPARVWVETGRYEVRGYDDGEGALVRLGSVAAFEGVKVPSWISIEETGRAPARFEVVGAERVVAPGAAFTQEWLYSVDAAAESSQAEPNLPARR